MFTRRVWVVSSVGRRSGDIQWAKLILTLENSVSKWAVRKTKVRGISVYFFFLASSTFFFYPFSKFFVKTSWEWMLSGVVDLRAKKACHAIPSTYWTALSLSYDARLWCHSMGGGSEGALVFCLGLLISALVYGMPCWSSSECCLPVYHFAACCRCWLFLP